MTCYEHCRAALEEEYEKSKEEDEEE